MKCDKRLSVVRSPVLALLFLLLAFPTILVQVFLTPPMQVADEENHFLRALQISGGHVFGHRIGGDNAGGTLDPAAPVLAHAFDPLKFKPSEKLDLQAFAVAASLRWGSGPSAPTVFPNTAIYPFYLYVPASAGLALGRLLRLSVLDSFYLGRLATAFASMGLAALSLAVCGRGRTLLFLILCFPMTLSLFGSVSQDAMSIALGAVAAATWSSYVARGLAMPPIVRAAVAVTLGALIAARIPLIPLYVLALLPTRSPPPGHRPYPRLVDAFAGMVGVIPLAIGVYGASAAKVAFRAGDGVSPVEQLRWLGSHPWDAVAVATRTISEDAPRHLHELVGVLGWLDTDFPPGFYTWMGVCVLLALLVDLSTGEHSLKGLWRYLPAGAVALSVIGVFGAFYLAWTPVGAPVVEGVQGRYFIVPAIMIALSLPRSRRQGVMWHFDLLKLQLPLCIAVVIVDIWLVPMTILHRYYG